MATPTTTTPTEASPLDQAFVADRAIFWARFTGFVKWGTILVALLVAAIYLLFG